MNIYKPPVPPGTHPEEVEMIWSSVVANGGALTNLKANIAPVDLTVLCAYLVAAMESQEPIFTAAFERARNIFRYQYPLMLDALEEQDPTLVRDPERLLIVTPHGFEEPTSVN